VFYTKHSFSDVYAVGVLRLLCVSSPMNFCGLIPPLVRTRTRPHTPICTAAPALPHTHTHTHTCTATPAYLHPAFIPCPFSRIPNFLLPTLSPYFVPFATARDTYYAHTHARTHIHTHRSRLLWRSPSPSDFVSPAAVALCLSHAAAPRLSTRLSVCLSSVCLSSCLLFSLSLCPPAYPSMPCRNDLCQFCTRICLDALCRCSCVCVCACVCIPLRVYDVCVCVRARVCGILCACM
jgi:hypothetical protein